MTVSAISVTQFCNLMGETSETWTRGEQIQNFSLKGEEYWTLKNLKIKRLELFSTDIFLNN